eukprot:GEZU01027931.1.p1 GENE.GEZU01027931.1~~GEZU01027931.1.p1  ORF type:complete len:240 (+),score=95.17 GEZU01027931.1:64-783(+)
MDFEDYNTTATEYTNEQAGFTSNGFEDDAFEPEQQEETVVAHERTASFEFSGDDDFGAQASNAEYTYEQQEETTNGIDYDADDYTPNSRAAPKPTFGTIVPEAIRQWQTKHQQEIADREAENQAKVAQIRAEAQAYLQEEMEKREAAKATKRNKNREHEEAMVSEYEARLHAKNVWESVVSFSDLHEYTTSKSKKIDATSPKDADKVSSTGRVAPIHEKDVSRMKQVLLACKNDPPKQK